MLEFYQSYSDYRDLMDLTEELIRQLAQSVLGKTEFEFEGQTISLANWRRYSLKEAVLGFGRQTVFLPRSCVTWKISKALSALARRWNDYASLKSLETVPPQDIAQGVLLGMLFEAVAERHWFNRPRSMTIPLSSHRSVRPKPAILHSSSALSSTWAAWRSPTLTAS